MDLQLYTQSDFLYAFTTQQDQKQVLIVFSIAAVHFVLRMLRNIQLI